MSQRVVPRGANRSDRRVTTLVFDLDDTLLDWSAPTVSWPDVQQERARHLVHYLAELGVAAPPARALGEALSAKIQEVWDEARIDWTAARLDDALARALAVYGIDAGSLDGEALLRAYRWEPIPGVVPFPDAHAVLDELQRRGFRLGLITNSFTPMWMRDIELAAHGLLDYFPVRLSSGDVGYIKPHPAIFRRALALLGASAAEAVYIGDRPAHDVAGANEVGMISVLMRPPHLDRELGDAVPDYTITSLSQLLPLADAWSAVEAG